MFSKLRPFLPLLALYIVLIVVFDKPLKGDEFRYLDYAENLSQGFYTDASNPDLSNGPGYPLILLPFVLLKTSYLAAKFLNGLFIFIGILYFYKTLALYIKGNYALLVAFALGLYPPLLKWMFMLYSESLAFMLMCGFIYHFCYLVRHRLKTWQNGFLASFYLGFLILTKVIFFHVTASALLFLAIAILAKKAVFGRLALFVVLGAFLISSPFIIYARSVTGKWFYLGTRGGEILYHRSTPYENEWGDWFSPDLVINQGEGNKDTKEVYLDLSELSSNHRDFYLKVEKLSNIQKDSAFKAAALSNMKEHPGKYVKNTISNVGRLLFNYPISYRSQGLNAYGYIIPNMFIIVLLILIMYPAFLARNKIPIEIVAILVLALIYGGAMTLLAGKPRYFIMMVPALFLFLGYCYTKLLKISFTTKRKT